MKRIIKNSEYDISTKILRYDIEVQLVSEIDAAIAPIHKDGSLDSAALAEYQEFLLNVLAILDGHKFEILEEKESTKSETSYYVSAFKKSESTSENIKCIFFIRISDHHLPKVSDAYRSKYYRSEAERLKQPKSKKVQRWKVKNIVVNEDTYNSYDEALEDIDKKLV